MTNFFEKTAIKVPRSMPRPTLALVFYVAASAVAAVLAQPLPFEAEPAWSQGEKGRIGDERLRLEQVFNAKEADCYARFFVNRCLNAIKLPHRQALADLRRQEVILEEEAYKRQGAERLLKIEEKALRDAQDAALQQSQAQEDASLRLQQEQLVQQKLQERQAQTQQLAAAESARFAQELQKTQRKKQARLDVQNKAAITTKKNHEKQAQAQQRRAEREENLRANGLRKSKPLPLPE